MRQGRFVEISERSTALGDGPLRSHVHLHRPHVRKIDDEAVVAQRVAGDVVARAADGKLDPIVAGEIDRVDGILCSGATGDDGGALVHHAVPDLARLVVLTVARSDDLALESLSELFDLRGMGSCHSSLLCEHRNLNTIHPRTLYPPARRIVNGVTIYSSPAVSPKGCQSQRPIFLNPHAGTSASRVIRTGPNPSAFEYQAAWDRSNRRAGVRGGWRTFQRRMRMRSITAGSSMAVMIFELRREQPKHALSAEGLMIVWDEFQMLPESAAVGRKVTDNG